MSIFIENYRGKDIFYNLNQEKFFADIDDSKEKNLIHLVRKDIDDYIKANMLFKPFKAFNSYYNGKELKTVVGIRKDKAFQCEGNSQISNYDLQDRDYNRCSWFVLKEEEYAKCILAVSKEDLEIEKLEKQIKVHKENIKGIVDQMKGEKLSDFRNRILGETTEQL